MTLRHTAGAELHGPNRRTGARRAGGGAIPTALRGLPDPRNGSRAAPCRRAAICRGGPWTARRAPIGRQPSMRAAAPDIPNASTWTGAPPAAHGGAGS